MARPKQRVNEENKNFIYRYFSIFFSEERYIFKDGRSKGKIRTNKFFKDNLGNETDRHYNALEDFKKIEQRSFNISELQQWVDKHITEYLWKKCLASLYQMKYIQDYEKDKGLYTIKLTAEVRSSLTHMQRITSMSHNEILAEALHQFWRNLPEEIKNK